MVILNPIIVTQTGQPKPALTAVPSRIAMALPTHGRLTAIKYDALRRQFEPKVVTDIDKDHQGVLIDGTLCIVAKDIPKLKFLRARYELAMEILERAQKQEFGGTGAFFTPSELSDECRLALFRVFGERQIEPSPQEFAKTTLLGSVTPSMLLSTSRGLMNLSVGGNRDPEESAMTAKLFNVRNRKVGVVRQQPDSTRSFDVLREVSSETYRFAVGLTSIDFSADLSLSVAQAVDLVYTQEFRRLNETLTARAGYLRKSFPKWLGTFGTGAKPADSEFVNTKLRLNNQLIANLYSTEEARLISDSAKYDRETLRIFVEARIQSTPSVPASLVAASFRVWP